VHIENLTAVEKE